MEYANKEMNTDKLSYHMIDEVLSSFRNRDGELSSVSPSQMSPLVLAYIGDTVYDLFVRTMLVESTTLSAHGLHMRAAKLVCAAAQSRAFLRIEQLLSEEEAILEDLTEEELAVYKRGRNAKTVSMAKHATMHDYRHATGFEALMGYLYLLGRDERLSELMRAAFGNGDNEPEKANPTASEDNDK